MKRIGIVVAAMIAGCGSEMDRSDPAREKAAALSRVEGAVVVCDAPALRSDEHLFVACRWDCVSVDGQTFREFWVTFQRESVDAPWAGPSVSMVDAPGCAAGVP